MHKLHCILQKILESDWFLTALVFAPKSDYLGRGYFLVNSVALRMLTVQNFTRD